MDTIRLQNHLSEAMKLMRPGGGAAGASGGESVDTKLITNLLLGFLTTPRGDKKRAEVLHVIANVCGWGEEERWRVGLIQRPTWQPSTEAAGQDSFTDAFVAFLMKETDGAAVPPPPARGSPALSPRYLEAAPSPQAPGGGGKPRRSSLIVSPMDSTLLAFGESPGPRG
jgi:hypothetical protein